MTTIVSVHVPEGADYRAKVTRWRQDRFSNECVESVANIDEMSYVLPGERRDFCAYTSNTHNRQHNREISQTVSVEAVPLAVGDRPGTSTCP